MNIIPVGIDTARLDKWLQQRRDDRAFWQKWREESREDWRKEHEAQRAADLHFITTFISRARLQRIFSETSDADEIREAVLEFLNTPRKKPKKKVT